MNSSVQKALIKEFVFYGFLMVLPQVAFVFLTKRITGVLTEREFYELGNLLFYRTIFYSLLLFGLESAITRRWADLKEEEKKNYLSTLLSFVLLSGVIISLILYAGFPYFQQWFKISITDIAKRQTIFYLIVSTIFFALNTIIKIVFRFNNRKNFYLFVSVLNAGLFFFLVFFLMGNSPEKLKFYSQILLVTEIVTFLLSLFLIKEYLTIILKISYLKEALKYGVFLMILSIISCLYNGLDRQLLENKISAAELANYFFNARMAQFIVFFTTAASSVISFFAVKNWHTPEGKKLIRTLQISYSYVAFIVAFFIISLTPFYFPVFNGKNYSITYIFSFFLLVNITLSFGGFGFLGSSYKNKTHINLIAYLLGICVFLFLAKVFVFQNYSFQIAISLLIGSVFCTAIGYIYTKRNFDAAILGFKNLLQIISGAFISIAMCSLIVKYKLSLFSSFTLFVAATLCYSLLFIVEIKKILHQNFAVNK